MFRNSFLIATLIAAVPCFSQGVNSTVEHNYLVIKLDNNWDHVSENGSLKTKIIEIPTCDWKQKEMKFDETVYEVLDVEVSNQLTLLNERYQDEGFPAEAKSELTDQTAYSSRDITYVVFKHKVNFEKTEILTILVLDQDSVSVFSQSNKLGEDVSILCGDKQNNEYIIYGHQKGNAESNWSGNFILKFSDFKRLLEYSRYEINE